jgi:trans-aconitate 2-methyltransferase
MSDTWNPERYDRFAEERRRPFFDLLALVQPPAPPAPGPRVVDLGCGTGALTRHLHVALGARETLGIDSSAAMLAKAQAAPGLRFTRGDIADFEGDAYDLVFSNAALHWLPDHERLVTRLTRALADGGQLAFQVPANFNHPSHVVADEVAREPRFAAALGGFTHATHVLAPEVYAALLDRLGFAEQRVRLEVYAHRLTERRDVVAWVEGTLLTGYRARLNDAEYAAFVERYAEHLLPRLGAHDPYLFTFKRILVWGRR